MAEIVNIGTLSKEKLAELADAGVEVKDYIDLDKLNLPEPGHGETFCFHAEPEEVALYAELYEVANQVDRWSRKIMGEAMVKAGKTIEHSALDKPWYEDLKDDGLRPEFESEEKEEEFFRLLQRKDFLRVLLYWKMGERGNLHAWRLGVRKPSVGDDKLRVVKIQKRLDTPLDG